MIKISKTFQYLNGTLFIDWQGEGVKDISKQTELLEKLIKRKGKKNIKELVSFIKTIFRDFNEELLQVSYEDENTCEKVLYINGNLKNYIKEGSDYSISYNQASKINLNYKKIKNISSYEEISRAKEEISKLIESIYVIEDVPVIKLDEEAKKLIQVYQLFYQQNPDFSEEDISIKIEAMLVILAGFDYSLNENYSFNMLRKGKMPISLYLEDMIDKLFPYGRIEEVSNPLKMDMQRLLNLNY